MFDPTPEKVKTIFDPYFNADIGLWAEFTKCLHHRSFKKNEIVKGYHKIEEYINILVAGSIAQFVLSNDKDICINLYYENQMFCDYLSFLTQKPTLLKTECLEDVEIWSLSRADLNTLYSKSVKGLAIGKAISDVMFMRKQGEQMNLLTLTPTERYLKLIEERPDIFKRTPLKFIASYMGVTAESLSRIRKRIS